MADRQEDEVHDIRARLRTLQNVAIEIKDVLDAQNTDLAKTDTLMHRSLRRVGASLRKIERIDRKRFGEGAYLALATLLFVVLVYVLFVL